MTHHAMKSKDMTMMGSIEEKPHARDCVGSPPLIGGSYTSLMKKLEDLDY